MTVVFQAAKRSSTAPVFSGEDDRYVLLLNTRCTIAGARYPAGTRLKVPADRLRVAAHLVKTGAARPLDRRTELDVELFERLQAVLHDA